jgi:hypothetical protein
VQFNRSEEKLKMDFTKIRWAGEEVLLVTTTESNNPRIPILILTKQDIEKLNKEFKNE